MDAQEEYDRLLRNEGYNEGFGKGAHQAMQETRLEIACNLITQVAEEENSQELRDVAFSLRAEICVLRRKP